MSGRASKKPRSAAHSPAGGAVRVMCVDDHAILIEGLKAQFALDGEIVVVGELDSSERVLDEVERVRPDVVLLDIDMPGPDVFEIADRLHRMRPDVRFLFLSAHVRDGYLAAAYKCGASGYFAKGDDLEDIVAGVKEAGRRESETFVLGPKVRERWGRVAPLPASSSNPPGRRRDQADTPIATSMEQLTAREIEILRLIGKGFSRTEIAAELSRSVKTVDGHQMRIMKKLGLETRADAMKYAIREGLAEA